MLKGMARLYALPSFSGISRLLRVPYGPTVYTSASALLTSTRYEEERSRAASIDRFYPMRLGEVVNERYQITAKLGWGQWSTVWLARDTKRWRWQSERYVAIKVPVWYPSETREEAVNREVAALRCVSNANDCHPGSRHVRKMLDTFELSHPKGQHVCMVLEPLRESLHTFSQLLVDDRIPIDLLRMMVKPILQGLDFLHTECRLIHADLKPDNIMLAFTAAKEQELLHQHAENEIKRPLPQKHLEDRTIYLSHNYFGPHGIGLPVIVDLDMAVPGDVEGHYSHPIQAEGLRAPEVLIGTPWSYSVDVWSLGTMLLYLMQDQDIFRVGARHTTDLGRMIACLGPVPMALLRRRVRSTDLFTAEGEFRELKVDKELTFESFVTRVDGKEKALFLNFVRRMLRWMPEERVSAKELLDDPWLDEER